MLPQPHNDHLSRAYDLISLCQFEQALAEIRQALAHDPHSADAHVCGAWAWRCQGRFSQAEQAARAALASQPDYAPALYTLALILRDQERLSEAEAAFRQAMRDPHSLRPLYLIEFANMLTAAGRFEEAHALSEYALVLAPDFSEAHRVYGRTLSCLGRLSEAEAAYREALRLDPRNHAALTSLGGLHLTLDQPVQAVDALRQALRVNPLDALARSQLAQALKARSPLHRWGKKLEHARLRMGFLLYCLLLLAVLMLGILTLMPHEPWFHFAGSGLYVALLAVVAQLLWSVVYDSVANTLLWFDPLGRQVHDFDLVDAVMVVHALCVLLGLGLGGSLLLTPGPVEPDPLRLALLGLSTFLLTFHGAVVMGTSWFRATQAKQIRLLDYLVVVAAPYAIVAAGLLDQRWQVPFHLLLGGVLLTLLCFFALRRRKPGA